MTTAKHHFRVFGCCSNCCLTPLQGIKMLSKLLFHTLARYQNVVQTAVSYPCKVSKCCPNCCFIPLQGIKMLFKLLFYTLARYQNVVQAAVSHPCKVSKCCSSCCFIPLFGAQLFLGLSVNRLPACCRLLIISLYSLTSPCTSSYSVL